SFKQHLLDTLKGKMRGGSLNLSGLHLLSGFNPQGDLKQWLHHQFRSAGLMGAADQLARGLYNIEICRTDKTAILETPDGYMQRRGSGVPELFSNFVVRLDANITFGEQTATHHAATILMDGETHATILPSRILDAPRELQEHVQMLLAARKNLSVPMLRDPVKSAVHGLLKEQAMRLRDEAIPQFLCSLASQHALDCRLAQQKTDTEGDVIELLTCGPCRFDHFVGCHGIKLGVVGEIQTCPAEGPDDPLPI
ncbi:MAG TPA: hypothetical protein PLB55_20290, partial [Prosthecobacter sp.]|nr:hypothetical protein [Prosthecobacter sp.]